MAVNVPLGGKWTYTHIGIKPQGKYEFKFVSPQ